MTGSSMGFVSHSGLLQHSAMALDNAGGRFPRCVPRRSQLAARPLFTMSDNDHNNISGRRGMMQLMLAAIAVGLAAGPSSPALGESTGAKKESFAAEAKSGGTAGIAVSVAKQTIRESSAHRHYARSKPSSNSKSCFIS
jgi:hypothetical protein